MKPDFWGRDWWRAVQGLIPLLLPLHSEPPATVQILGMLIRRSEQTLHLDRGVDYLGKVLKFSPLHVLAVIFAHTML